ncbi:MAG TPA: hypothetical protein VMI54_18990 [Polyangiaceae bacterium]|nr:hypothetical protein [Polyangiaceae bacterium]
MATADPANGAVPVRRARAALQWRLGAEDRARLGAFTLDALTLVVTAAVFLALNRPFWYAATSYDEEFFTWGGWCITKGLVVYRDFLEFKPPIAFFTHAIAIALFGLKNYGYRTFFTFAPLSAVLLLQTTLLARGIERFLVLAMTVGFVALFVNTWYHDTALSDCESIGLMYYTLGLAGFLYEGRHAKAALFAGGFFMSCAVLSKEPIGGVVGVTWVGAFFLRGATTLASAKRFASASLLGVAAFFVILCLYMVPTGAMKGYVELLHAYSRIYRDPKTSYCVAAGVARPDDGFEVAWNHIRQYFLNENTLGYLAPLALPGAVFAFRRSIGLFLTMVAATCAGLWAAVPTMCMWVHYCVMSMAGVLYVLVASVDSLKWPLRAADRRVRIATSAVACLAVATYVYPTLSLLSNMHFQRVPWQEPQPGILAFIAAHTTPQDRIFTTGTPQLYARSDRISAARETNIIDEILPSYEGDTDEERLRPLYEELVKNRPKVVFLDPENEHRKGRHLRTLLYPFLERFHYRAVNPRLYLRP